MLTILIGFFTVVLVLTCAFVVLIVLMQRASSNAGLGSALGGGATESALGGGASNILTRGTVWGAALFFIMAFALYLGHMANYEGSIRPAASLLDADAIAPVEEAAPSALQGSLTETEDASAAAQAQPIIQSTIVDSADAKATDAEAAAQEAINKAVVESEQPAAEIPAEATPATETPAQEQAEASAE